MKTLINKFEALNGAKFININNYVAKTSGEVANHNINTNISVEAAKRFDLMQLKKRGYEMIMELSVNSGIALEVYEQALNEMIESGEKNLSKDKENRTKQSQSQTDAYIPLTKNGSIKLNKETLAVHVFGLRIKKTVLQAGEAKKPVNSSNKTIAKQNITKALNLRSGKFVNYILGNAESVTITGDTINVV